MLFVYLIGALTAIVLVVELALRYFFGFGRVITYVESANYEYIPSPNQSIKRLGKQIIYNEHSMRSLPLNKQDEVLVLWMGDSIVNGGNATSHENLATTQTEQYFQKKYEKPLRILNIAAGSWEPDNVIAYLKQHGHFGAKMLLLTFSSHDALHYMTFEKFVGQFPDYPNQQPLSAISEIFVKYILPKIIGDPYKRAYHKQKNDPTIPDSARIKPRTTLNTGFMDLIEYAEKHQLLLHFNLHAELQELKNKEYDHRGKMIIDWFNAMNVSYTLEMEFGATANMYRDAIHFNEAGQTFMSNLAINTIETKLGQVLGK